MRSSSVVAASESLVASAARLAASSRACLSSRRASATMFFASCSASALICAAVVSAASMIAVTCSPALAATDELRAAGAGFGLVLVFRLSGTPGTLADRGSSLCNRLIKLALEITDLVAELGRVLEPEHLRRLHHL